jgi:hypothetical protein
MTLTERVRSPTTMTTTTDTLTILPEPRIEFGRNQYLHDPHDGLALFGPFDAASANHPKSIPYATVGTMLGIAAFLEWSRTIQRAIIADPIRDAVGRRPLNEALWPPYPGFEAAFCSTWPERPVWSKELDGDELTMAATNLDPSRRTFDVVNAYLLAIQTAMKRDERPTVIICVVPEEVWANCRPESRVVEGTGTRVPAGERAARRAGQTNLFESFDPQQYQLSVDFRRQLKARVMEHAVPVQIVRETTLRVGPKTKENARLLTPLPDRAWNLSTAFYYKSGAKPWRLAEAREGVCYIGIAFRKADQPRTSACCAAQMFLDSGDGIVFLGQDAPWYSDRERQFHLSRASARRLLSGVLATYAELDGRELREIFLHYRSEINDEEFAGFRDACPPGVRLVGIRVRPDRYGVRLFRPGVWPVLRGTFWKVRERTGFLWASGFKPRWETYDGWEMPVPLRIDIQHGQAEIEQVARDIFGLTKLNYNACRLGNTQPVTIGFSDAVGEILVANPRVPGKKPNFKYYI